MKPTLNEKFLAYLALFSGLTLSVVAEYYSILGLTAIFAAAVIPVIIMGIALGLGKITATLWLKQNWNIAPWSVRAYLFVAILVLMLITSMGIFGFLSKAHSDQSLVSGDVTAKIAVYDEKIKTAKENIDANRKALKQMDEAVDQVMGRSTDEKGADKAVALRRTQQKERARLLAEIEAEQKKVSSLSEERAPIAAEVRKVEAEVGPIKYIAAFVYGDTDTTVLEKAVTWVIIILIVVFDPLAVILLLSSQISFQNFREREKTSINDFVPQPQEYIPDPDEDVKPDAWVADVGEKPTAEELAEGDSPEKESDVVSTATVTAQEVAEVIPEAVVESPTENPHPVGWMFSNETPVVKAEISRDVLEELKTKGIDAVAEIKASIESEGAQADITIVEDHEPTLTEKVGMYGYSTENGIVKVKDETYTQQEFNSILEKEKTPTGGYVQNEEQTESGVWNRVISEQEYRQKLEAKKENESNNNTNNPA
jgi:hypothetical protein